MVDDAEDSHITVASIHNEQGYRNVRERLARSYDPSEIDPDIQISDVDLKGDRTLQLQHTVRNGIALNTNTRDEVLRHVRALWGYDVVLNGVDAADGRRLYTTSTKESAAAAE